MNAFTTSSSRRALLLAVAGTMIAAAALAIGILLFGDFGGTEGRILITTVLLAGHGALAVPTAILHDQRRLPRLVLAGAALLACNAALNVAGVWVDTDSELLGKVTGTVWTLAVATVLTTALAVQRRRHRLFLPSIALAYLTASMLIGGMWAETESGAYFRVLGALAVLTVLLAALQPLLLRARRERAAQPLRLVDDTGGTFEVVVEADSPAAAAERAIRDAERHGRHVRSVELLGR